MNVEQSNYLIGYPEQDTTNEQIPSLDNMSDAELDRLRGHLIQDVVPAYLADIEAAREEDEEALYDKEGEPIPAPDRSEFPSDADYQTALIEWVPDTVKRTETIWQQERLGFREHTNNLRLYFNPDSETHNIDTSVLPAATMLRELRDSDIGFWQQCQAQVKRHDAAAHDYIDTLQPMPGSLEGAAVRAAIAADAASVRVAESWLTERYMQDVVGRLLAANLPPTASREDTERLYTEIRTLCMTEDTKSVENTNNKAA